MTNSGEQPPRASPDRRLSAHEFDRLIRRAAQLQAERGETTRPSLTEAEALQIGRQLGLSLDSLHRALSETVAQPPEKSGMLERLLGREIICAARAIRGDAATIASTLERYLVEREHLVVQRRLGDRVVFTRAAGIPAALMRTASRLVRRWPLLEVTTLDVTVHPLDDGTSYVTVSTMMRSTRTATAAGAALGGGAGAAVTALLLTMGAIPEVAILVAPLSAAAAGAGGRAHHRNRSARMQMQLESLLDRVEHGDLPKGLLRMIPRLRTNI